MATVIRTIEITLTGYALDTEGGMMWEAQGWEDETGEGWSGVGDGPSGALRNLADEMALSSLETS